MSSVGDKKEILSIFNVNIKYYYFNGTIDQEDSNPVGDKLEDFMNYKYRYFNGSIEEEFPNSVGDKLEEALKERISLFIDLINTIIIYGLLSILSPTDLEDYDKSYEH